MFNRLRSAVMAGKAGLAGGKQIAQRGVAAINKKFKERPTALTTMRDAGYTALGGGTLAGGYLLKGKFDRELDEEEERKLAPLQKEGSLNPLIEYLLKKEAKRRGNAAAAAARKAGKAGKAAKAAPAAAGAMAPSSAELAALTSKPAPSPAVAAPAPAPRAPATSMPMASTVGGSPAAVAANLSPQIVPRSLRMTQEGQAAMNLRGGRKKNRLAESVASGASAGGVSAPSAVAPSANVAGFVPPPAAGAPAPGSRRAQRQQAAQQFEQQLAASQGLTPVNRGTTARQKRREMQIKNEGAPRRQRAQVGPYGEAQGFEVVSGGQAAKGNQDGQGDWPIDPKWVAGGAAAVGGGLLGYHLLAGGQSAPRQQPVQPAQPAQPAPYPYPYPYPPMPPR